MMPRDRYEAILSFLHFNDNSNQIPGGVQSQDRLFKIRPLLDLLEPKFSELYHPKKELSLDEMTIAFKGRSMMKLYNKSKPDKWGYKVFVVSEATSGYVLKFFPYVGKVSDENDDGVLHSHRVVRNLMNSFKGKGHELYIDSYYSSIDLAKELVQGKIGVCGTVNPNRRNIPSVIKTQQLRLEKGDKPVFMRNGRLLLCAWQDTKRVTMLSSIHTNECIEKRIRSKSAVGGHRTILVPKAVADYNCFMGGVDKSGQRMKTYLFPHRSRKWYP